MNEKNNPPSPDLTQKSVQRLASGIMAKFTVRCFISGCLYGVGLLTALLCNFAFLQGLLGFLLGSTVFVIAIACQAGFGVSAFAALSPDSDTKRQEVFFTSCAASAIGLTLWAFCLPMAFAPYNTGIALSSLLLYGTACAAVMAAICFWLYTKADRIAQNKGLYLLSDSQKQRRTQNTAILKSCGIVWVCGLAVIFMAHMFFDLFAEPTSFAKPLVFWDVDSFIEYIETPVTPEGHAQLDTDITYYDQYGNEISYEAALGRDILDEDGNVVGRYVHLNENVTRITYSWTDGKPSFYLYTIEQMQNGDKIVNTVYGLFVAAYYVWTAGTAVGGIVAMTRKKQQDHK